MSPLLRVQRIQKRVKRGSEHNDDNSHDDDSRDDDYDKKPYRRGSYWGREWEPKIQAANIKCLCCAPRRQYQPRGYGQPAAAPPAYGVYPGY